MSMPLVASGPELDLVAVEWPEAWRIIASRFPPIDLFERVSNNPAVWDVLIALEQMTNPRVRDAAGEISLVPPDRRVSGPNASWVMAPFTHINTRGSRFADGTFGVYYAARELKTAIAETGYHFARFAQDSSDLPRREDMRVLLGAIDHRFHDVSSLSNPLRSRVLDRNSYAESQKLAAACRDNGSDGFVYSSVRHEGGACIAAFWPDVVKIPIQERHLQYEWDGEKLSRYFDYQEQRWHDFG